MLKSDKQNKYQILIDDLCAALIVKKRQRSSVFQKKSKSKSLLFLFEVLENKFIEQNLSINFSEIHKVLSDDIDNDGFSFQDWLDKVDESDKNAFKNLKILPEVKPSSEFNGAEEIEQSFVLADEEQDFIFAKEEESRLRKRGVYSSLLSIVFICLSALIVSVFALSKNTFNTQLSPLLEYKQSKMAAANYDIPNENKVIDLFDIRTANILSSKIDQSEDILLSSVDYDDQSLFEAVPANISADEWKYKRLKERADLGDPRAQHDIALAYLKGDLANAPQALEKSFFYLSKSADQNYKNSIYNLAVMYQQGLYVPINIEKSADLFEKAALFDHAAAHYNLGVMILNGKVYKGDYKKAMKHFKDAYTLGVNEASMMIAKLYASGALNYGHAREDLAYSWYKKARDHGIKGADKAMKDMKSASR